MTGFFKSDQNPFYKFKVIAKAGDLGIKEIKREVSINDRGQIAFVGSGFEEDWTVITHTPTEINTIVKQDHVFAFDDQLGLRDLSKKVILATARNPEYGISKPNLINYLSPSIKNPARTFDIFRTSYISPGTDASDRSSGIQINNNGDIIVRRFEISGGWTFLGLKQEDFGVYPFHYWTPEPNKYASFLETWSASNPSDAQSPELISQGFIPSYLYSDTYSPIPIPPLQPIRVYEPDFAAQANNPSINNKGEVVFRAFGPDNWIAIHDPSNPVIKPQVQDANMYKAKVPDLDFNVWSSDNDKFLRSSSKSLEVFNKQFEFTNIGSDFSSLGYNSRISDDGSIVTFYADGEIWAAIDLPQGTRSTAQRLYVKVAGLAGNGLLDPGENKFDFNLNGELDDGEHEDGIFSKFDSLSVVAVNSTHIDEEAGDDSNNNGSIDKDRDEFTVVFIGYDLNGKKGIYSNRVAFFEFDGAWEIVPTTPTLVAEVGMSLAGLDGTITDIDIHDPVNNYDKGDIAFWVKTSTGQTAVIKSRRQEVLYIDFDPQRSTAIDLFSDDIGRLSSMGSLLQAKIINSGDWEGNLDTYITKASHGNRNDLINNLQQIKDQIIATVQSDYDNVGANVVVTDKRPIEPGQYKYLSIGDISGEAGVRGYFGSDSRNQQIGISDSRRFFNLPILHGVVFVDGALGYGEWVGLYKDSAGRSIILPVDLSQLDNSSILNMKNPVYQGLTLVRHISKDVLVRALSKTISHEFGHSLGLFHLDRELDPRLVVRDELIMGTNMPYDTSVSGYTFSTNRIPLAEFTSTQNDKQRLGQSVGSDSKFQRDPTTQKKAYVYPPTSDLSELKDPGYHNRSAFFTIWPFTYLNPLFSAEIKAGTVLSLLEVLPDPDGYQSPIIVNWELSDDSENWKLAAQMTEQYTIRPDDIGKQIRAIYSYIDGRGLHVTNFISGSLANDQTSLDIVAISADKAEGNSGSTAFTFTVTRSGDLFVACSATWTVSGSGATPATGSDFTGNALPTNTVSFAVGQSTATITVDVNADTTVENDEAFSVTLSNPSGASIYTATASGIIRNDDAGGGDSSSTPTTTTPATTPAASVTPTPSAESPALGIPPQASVQKVQLSTPVIFGSLAVSQAVVGTNQRDSIIGSDASEALTGGLGRDQITGGKGPDAFVFETAGEFGKRNYDTITDFNPPEGDKVVISTESFTGITRIVFQSAKGKKAVKAASKAKVNLIYDSKSGMLYFDSNGKKNGWGDGGEFAKLLGAPDISQTDFVLV